MQTVEVSGRTIATDQITHAITSSKSLELTVYPVGYYELRTGGEEARTAINLLMKVGFVEVEPNILVNPRRIILTEPQGELVRLYMNGVSKVLYIAAANKEKLFPALETLALEPVPASVEKVRRTKKAE